MPEKRIAFVLPFGGYKCSYENERALVDSHVESIDARTKGGGIGYDVRIFCDKGAAIEALYWLDEVDEKHRGAIIFLSRLAYPVAQQVQKKLLAENPPTQLKVIIVTKLPLDCEVIQIKERRLRRQSWPHLLSKRFGKKT
ncbi:hypothetical protein COB52_03455 [Candidatus Kaiserbacteria bacterium]|nr:MAG: hypothetical protein COB52_03455 [Candidatus Kaiserbacteria bacterium]